MFERKKKQEDKKLPKFKTFGSDTDEDEQDSMEGPQDVTGLLGDLDKAITTAKKDEKNAAAAKVYSSNQSKSKRVPEAIKKCGCFS